MTVLLCERLNDANDYIRQLAKHYQSNGHQVILDVQNFLFSDFIPDLVHIQWPEAVYRWRYKLPHTSQGAELFESRLAYFKAKGVPIAYTVHNLLPHENVTDFDLNIYTLVLKYSDIIIHHGSKSVELLGKGFPEAIPKKHIICPHGPYSYEPRDREGSRRFYNFSEDKVVFLNFGRMRDNKGPNFAREVFRSWRNPNAVLFTIGPKQYSGRLGRVKKIKDKMLSSWDNNVSQGYRTFFRQVADEEIPFIFAAADVVFLSHLAGLNSGVATLAASSRKPVVFPTLGNIEEQLDQWDWKASYSPGDIDSAINALNAIVLLQKRYKGEGIVDNHAWLEKNSWDMHVRNIVEAAYQLKSHGYL